MADRAEGFFLTPCHLDYSHLARPTRLGNPKLLAVLVEEPLDLFLLRWLALSETGLRRDTLCRLLRVWMQTGPRHEVICKRLADAGRSMPELIESRVKQYDKLVVELWI